MHTLTTMKYDEALQLAFDVAREIHPMMLREVRRVGGPRGERDHAPIDREIEDAVRERLRAALPWRFLGEESGRRDGPLDAPIWIVDPNDGTRAFLNGARGSALSIALVHDGRPVLGVVLAFTYPDDDGDLIAWAEGCGSITRNGAPVSASLETTALDRYAVVLVSDGAVKNPSANADCCAPARFRALPSIAYRLALVAAGEAVAAVSTNGPQDWDYAAGHALLRGVGGTLVDQDGREVTYAADGSSHVRACFGGRLDVARKLAGRSWSRVLERPPSLASEGFALVSPAHRRRVLDAGVLRRAQGCLLGQLAGDALGQLVEFRTARDIARSYPNGVRELVDGGAFDTLAGQPTDDSELALMLARSLEREGRFDAGAALESYVHWLESRPFDVGRTIGTALRAASRGKTREERLALAKAKGARESLSNGALMRVSPLAIFGALRPDEVTGWAREDCAITHPRAECASACAAFVAAIAAAIRGRRDARGAYDAAVAEASKPEGHPMIRDALARAEHATVEDFSINMGLVTIALQNAFYQLLHAPTFEEGIVDTVMQGGDTDTNAAIAGALLGAVHGRDAIPLRWRNAVLTCRAMPRDGVRHPRPAEMWATDTMDLAEALVAMGGAR